MGKIYNYFGEETGVTSYKKDLMEIKLAGEIILLPYVKPKQQKQKTTRKQKLS